MSEQSESDHVRLLRHECEISDLKWGLVALVLGIGILLWVVHIETAQLEDRVEVLEGGGG